jgi:AcrR family transcriptional regulator
MEPRKIRKERRQKQVREEILAAARSVLLDKGLAGLTLVAVARRLQLTKAALYYYFPSKDALAFELIHRGLATHADVVEAAVRDAASGADAIEALIRASFAHYSARRDELRLAYLVPQVGTGGARRMSAEELARIRPFNDRMYGTVGNKIAADQRAGRVAGDVDGRRLAFLAHMAVLGVLVIEGVVEVADSAPLIHSQRDMVDELVRTFRARLG